MADPKELLTQADSFIPDHWDAKTDRLIRELVAALRAALAAQPQPLFEGTPVELRRWLRGSYPSTEVNTATSLAVYPAVAGSAIPTDVDSHGFTDAEHDTLVTLIDRNPKRVQQLLTLRSAAVAESATPTARKENDDE